jgi:hypothetical protein
VKPAPILGGLVAGVLILAGIWYFERPTPAVAPATPPAAAAPAPEAREAREAAEKPEAPETPAPLARSSSPEPATGVKPAPVVPKRARDRDVSKPSPAGVAPEPASRVPLPTVGTAPQTQPQQSQAQQSQAQQSQPQQQPQPQRQPQLQQRPQSELQPMTSPQSSSSASSPTGTSRPVLKRLETPHPPLTMDDPPPPSRSATPRLYKQAYNGPSSGNLKYSGPAVIQNGEIVFRNLPDTNLRLIYDRNAWDGRLSPDGDGSQKLVMRSLKPGSQKKCEVKWEVSGH